MNPAQRTTYEQIFGDPLDWVRRRLRHRSVETTFKYLHTLNELAMETRLALVPDEWAEFGLSAGELAGEVADEQSTDVTADSRDHCGSSRSNPATPATADGSRSCG